VTQLKRILRHLMKAAVAWLDLRSRGARRFWALVCLVLLLVIQALAASPQLHELIHPDADLPGHHCVVTTFAHGKVEAAAGFVTLAVFVAVVIFFQPPVKSAVVSSFDYRLTPSRAPPLA
jgi:hypothetical protein